MKRVQLILLIMITILIVGCDGGSSIDLPDSDSVAASGGDEIAIGGVGEIGGNSDDSDDDADDDEELGEGFTEIDKNKDENTKAGKLKLFANGDFPSGVVNKEYPTSNVGVTVYGGEGQKQMTVSGLPGGVTYDSLEKEISGIPTEIGNFEIVITVTDEAGATKTATKSMRIADDKAINLYVLTNGIQGELLGDVTYGSQIIAEVIGGESTYEWEVTIDGSPVLTGENGTSVTIDLPFGEEAEKEVDLRVKTTDSAGDDEDIKRTLFLEGNPCLGDLDVAFEQDTSAFYDGYNAKKIYTANGVGPFKWTNARYQKVCYDVNGDVMLDEDIEILDDGMVSEVKMEYAEDIVSGLQDNEMRFIYYAVETGDEKKMLVAGASRCDVTASITVEDSCSAVVGSNRSADVEPVMLMTSTNGNGDNEIEDTLADLKVEVDFGSITGAKKRTASMGVYIFVDGKKVAKYEWKLKTCQENADLCEGAQFVTLMDGLEDADKKLSDYKIKDITDVQLRFHKNRAPGSASKQDKMRLRLSAKYLKLSTKNYFALLDFEKKNVRYISRKRRKWIVGGLKHTCNSSSKGTRWITDLFKKFEGESNIWHPTWMLGEGEKYADFAEPTWTQ